MGEIGGCQPQTWEFEGIRGDGPKPAEVGAFTGPAIICAGARGVYEEFEAAGSMLVAAGMPRYATFAVNEIGAFLRVHLNAIITAHPEFADLWLARRARMKAGNVPLIYSDHAQPIVNVVFDNMGYEAGTSGLVACLIVLTMGYSPIILCGMQCDPLMPSFHGPYPWGITDESHLLSIEKTWRRAKNHLPTFACKIRSMSGRTREWLGAPSVDWCQSFPWFRESPCADSH